MRKIAVSLLGLLLLTAAGCGKNAPDPNAPAARTSAAPATSSSGSGGSSSSTAPSGSTSSSGGSSSAATSGSSGGSTAGSSTSTSGSAAKSTAPAAPQRANLGPLKIGELAKIGPIEVTMQEIYLVQKAAGIPPGWAYLLIKINVANQDKAPYTMNITDYYKVMMPNDKAGRYNVSATAQRQPKLSGTLQPGESQSGWAGYLIQVIDGTYKLTIGHPDFGDATWEFKL